MAVITLAAAGYCEACTDVPAATENGVRVVEAKRDSSLIKLPLIAAVIFETMESNFPLP